MMVTDAARAVSALLNVRKYTEKMEDRGALAQEAIGISEEAVGASQTQPRRGGFEEVAKNAEERKYLKGLEVGKTDITTPQGKKSALSMLIQLDAEDKVQQMRDLLDKITPPGKSYWERRNDLMEKYGRSGRDYAASVKEAKQKIGRQWIEDNPDFDAAISAIEAYFQKTFTPVDLRDLTTDNAVANVFDGKANPQNKGLAQQAIKAAWPYAKEFRAKGLRPGDLAKIALERAKKGISSRYQGKEAAD